MNYTFDEIQNELNNYGFNLIQYKSTKELISKDKDGYKYKINLCNLRNGKQPNRFMKNPFALDNFKLYLQNKIKLDYCKKNNIELLIIPYWDYDNIEKILEPYASKALSLCEKSIESVTTTGDM